jgi:hypothetical protein
MSARHAIAISAIESVVFQLIHLMTKFEGTSNVFAGSSSNYLADKVSETEKSSHMDGSDASKQY